MPSVEPESLFATFEPVEPSSPPIAGVGVPAHVDAGNSLIHDQLMVNFGNGTTAHLIQLCDQNDSDDDGGCKFCLINDLNTCFSHEDSVRVDRIAETRTTGN